MPNYIIKALERLKHPAPFKPRHAPHRWVRKIFGQKVHLAPTEDTSEVLSPQATQHIQRVVGTFLYYIRAIDNTIQTAVNEIAVTQAAPTEETKDANIMLMDYLHTHPKAKIRYNASGMQLYIDSDAAYLVAPKAKSRVAGYFYLSDKYVKNSEQPTPTLNGTIHIECKLLNHVVSLAA